MVQKKGERKRDAYTEIATVKETIRHSNFYEEIDREEMTKWKFQRQRDHFYYQVSTWRSQFNSCPTILSSFHLPLTIIFIRGPNLRYWRLIYVRHSQCPPFSESRKLRDKTFPASYIFTSHLIWPKICIIYRRKCKKNIFYLQKHFLFIEKFAVYFL